MAARKYVLLLILFIAQLALARKQTQRSNMWYSLGVGYSKTDPALTDLLGMFNFGASISYQKGFAMISLRYVLNEEFN